jgi:hypothetical protein
MHGTHYNISVSAASIGKVGQSRCDHVVMVTRCVNPTASKQFVRLYAVVSRPAADSVSTCTIHRTNNKGTVRIKASLRRVRVTTVAVEMQ